MEATRNISTIAAQLEAASVCHEGRRYVRAVVAARIIGVGPGLQTRWIRSKRITPLRFRVKLSPKAPIGLVTAWPLDQAVACAEGYRPMRVRRWSTAQDAELERLLGKLTHEQIGRRLGRTAGAVRRRAIALGINPRNADGLLTTPGAAELLGVSRQAVTYWCNNGLKHRTEPGGQRARLIHPHDLVTWAKQRPAVWSRLKAERRRYLEHIGASRIGRAA